MLQIKNISKQYITGDLKQTALDNVSLNLRDSEFVAILGQSGSGKTTFLNIIGGLDRYDTGDIIINGISTKRYNDRDWDSYRNHTIGFVFQSYNLIPHQSILSNVELALTISGISKDERKKRAQEALDKVGLGDQSHKRPNQMSGGQMQRVAIARSLVNNPDILLADEPTGALDSETSIQVMDLLKEVAKDRLVIMVTHNPELAERYASRIVRLKDGKVISDSNPFEIAEGATTPPTHKNMGKSKMSFLTAMSLSLNNLLTKKTRTLLTAFAGSIGIIGIALILSLSSGMQSYIQSMQEDTLSTYPLQIESESIDIASMMSSMMGSTNVDRTDRDPNKVYSGNIMTDMMKSLSSRVEKNDLQHFKEYLESSDGTAIKDLTNTIQYSYNLDLQIYNADTSKNVLKVNPSNIFTKIMGVDTNSAPAGMGSLQNQMPNRSMSGNTWSELIDNRELLEKQYDVLAGHWPTNPQEIVLVVDENNELSDAVLYTLGILDQDELDTLMEKVRNGEEIGSTPISEYAYDDLLKLSFKVINNTDIYALENNVWQDKSSDQTYMRNVVDQGLELKVVGVLKPNAELTATAITGSIAYTPDLTKLIINNIQNSDIVHEQQNNPDVDILTGLSFKKMDYDAVTVSDVDAYIATLPELQQAQMGAMMQGRTDEEKVAMFVEIMKSQPSTTNTYDSNMTLFGVVDLDNPSKISIYAKDFDSKDQIVTHISDYNTLQKNNDDDQYVINYTDIMAVMMSSVTSIINIITYVLIAFVAISLVVSSIMIAIITYISVLERTKEIGILRSIGASKTDISRVFNAETVIEGLVAGLLGIGITLLLNVPINMIIKSFTGISTIASLPTGSAILLIVLSVVLTVVAGLVPARMAAKKDPVEALRSE